MKYWLAIFYLTFFHLSVFGQRLSGKIKDDAGKPLQASISIKDSKETNLIREFYQSDEDGFFDFSILSSQSKIIFEIRAMGYASHLDSIISPQVNKTYFQTIILKTTTLELNEVVVSAIRTVVVKSDTTEYYPKNFLNGTERKVEDLIKHLPGMEVSENGSIKYFGKTVESVQFDGDDLLGDKYALGTKNIAVDLVEKVQAIDNFTANPLLKGLVESETVSLNLVLKKTKTKFTADGIIGLGAGNGLRKDFGFNILAFNSRFKSFGNATHNNIGVNYGMYDYFTSKGAGNPSTENKLAEKIISEDGFLNNLNSDNTRINNDFTANYSFLIRFTKKLSLKAYTTYANESLENQARNRIEFLNEKIIYDDFRVSTKSPINKEIGFKFDYRINQKNMIIFETGLRKEKNKFTANVVQNQHQKINTLLLTNSTFWNNSLDYTLKLNQYGAIQYKSSFATNTVPQQLNFSSNFDNLVGDKQNSDVKKDYIENQLLFFYSKNAVKINWIFGNNISINKLQTNLFLGKNEVANYKNDFVFNLNSSYSDFNLIFKYNLWKIKPNIRLTEYKQKVTFYPESKAAKKKELVVAPELNIEFIPNSLHKVYLSSKLEYLPTSTQNLFIYGILENSRSIKKNLLNLDLQKTQKHRLIYRYNEPFLFFSTLVGFEIKKDFNSYLSSIDFNENYTTLTYFKFPTNTDNFTLFLGFDKLISPLKTTFKYSSNIGVLKYRNVVNESEIRSNKSFFQNHNLFIRTGFSLPFGVENKFSFNTIQSQTNNQFNNKIIAWSNNLKFIYKPMKTIQFITALNIVAPNVKQKSKYQFWDFELNYKPDKQTKIIEYRIIGKNLLNTKFYRTVENNDYSIVNYESNLLQRYLMLQIGFRF